VLFNILDKQKSMNIKTKQNNLEIKLSGSLEISFFAKLSLAIVVANYIFQVFANMFFLDLWGDEIGRILDFTLVPLETTVTYYTPQNHVFYDLINNIFLNILQIKSFNQIAEHTWILRSISLCYSLLTIYVTYCVAVRLFGKRVAMLSVVILSTTIPFYNFSSQISGYPLCAMFTILTVYFQILIEESEKKIIFFVLLSLTSSLLIYSNPYCLYICIGFISARIFTLYFNKNKAPVVSMFSISIGIILSILLYSPIFGQMFSSSYAKMNRLFNFDMLFVNLPVILMYFLSSRYLLIFIIPRMKSIGRIDIINFIASFIVLLMPFILAFLRGDNPYDRLFIPLAPIFSIILAFLFIHFNIIFLVKNIGNYVIPVVSIYSLVVFNYEIRHVKNRLEADIANDIREQDIYYSFHNYKYKPSLIVSKINELGYHGEHVYWNGNSLIENYLLGYGMKPYKLEEFDGEMFENGNMFLVTTAPSRAMEGIHEEYPFSSCRISSPAGNYDTLLYCKCEDQRLCNKNIINLDRIKNALESYYNSHGNYPISEGFDGYFSRYGKSSPDWISGLAPNFINSLPRDPRKNNDPSNQYLYASDGRDYKLIAHHPDDGDKVKQLFPTMIDPVRGILAYGYWTPNATSW